MSCKQELAEADEDGESLLASPKSDHNDGGCSSFVAELKAPQSASVLTLAIPMVADGTCSRPISGDGSKEPLPVLRARAFAVVEPARRRRVASQSSYFAHQLPADWQGWSFGELQRPPGVAPC